MVKKMSKLEAIRDFCDRVAKLNRGVEAVTAELDGSVQHVTTFLAERNTELEAKIYKVEASVLQRYPEAVLNFHVRVVPKDDTGNSELPDRAY
jgi:hypothetical protein